jgi:RimJ/RimL family protein N-acetyltransferase
VTVKLCKEKQVAMNEGARVLTVTPIVLEGERVRLEPLTREHLDALCEVGLDPELWRWSPTPVWSRDEMAVYLRDALDAQERGHMLPFATIERASAKLVGSTRYGNIDLAHRRLEIGWTWVAQPWQRTAVNTEAKLLMLQHAFGLLRCHRVEFKTDALNERSREALLRLGAKEEGVFRKHIVTASGRVRDTVYYSIIDTEWPDVEKRLKERLARRAT